MKEITKSQKGQMWRLFGAACQSQGVTTSAEKDEYRHRVMREELGVEHLADVNACEAYDKLMARLALDAGEYELFGKYSGGAVGRYRHEILRKVSAIVEDHQTTPEAYVAGILFKGRMVYHPFDTAETYGKKLEDEGTWTDIPEPTLRLLLQIVTTEYRKAAAK